MAVGVGSGVDNNELKSIAMGTSDNVLKLKSFDQLADNLKNLTKDLCQGMNVAFRSVTALTLLSKKCCIKGTQ